MHKPFAEEIKIEGVILTRIMPGEDLFAGLKKIAKNHGIERGVILSAIGSLKNVVLRNVNSNIKLPVKLENTNEMEEKGPFELISLEGNTFHQKGMENLLFMCMSCWGPLQVVSWVAISLRQPSLRPQKFLLGKL